MLLLFKKTIHTYTPRNEAFPSVHLCWCQAQRVRLAVPAQVLGRPWLYCNWRAVRPSAQCTPGRKASRHTGSLPSGQAGPSTPLGWPLPHPCGARLTKRSAAMEPSLPAVPGGEHPWCTWCGPASEPSPMWCSPGDAGLHVGPCTQVLPLSQNQNQH